MTKKELHEVCQRAAIKTLTTMGLILQTLFELRKPMMKRISLAREQQWGGGQEQ